MITANGAKLDSKTEDGKTPLDLAIKLHHTKIVDLLKAHMAKQKPPTPAKAP